ncbi:MAG: glycosyltransferase family 2 protein [Anaerorhabdus sp.]
MKLSVIIPMFNMEDYIEQCLISLVTQTFKDFEILVINDGSTDSSFKIVERMSLTYPIIKLISKVNGGLSSARNHGIDYALGDYITFIDSDDYVEPKYLEKMINKVNEGYDIVCCDINYFYESKHPSWISPGITPWNIIDMKKKALLSSMFVWNKVYKRSFFKEYNIKFPKDIWFEDILVNQMIITKSDKIGYVNEALVNYRQRFGSIMSSNNSKKQNDIFVVLDMVRDYYIDNDLMETYHDEIEYLHIENLCLFGMFRFMRSDNFEQLYRDSMKVMKKNFPKWKRNKYIRFNNDKNKYFLLCLNRFSKNILRFIIRNR